MSNTELQKQTEEDLLNKMSQALTLSQQLLTMAENNEWDNFEQVLQSRDQVLNGMAIPAATTTEKPNISDSSNTQLAANFEEIRSIQSKLQHLVESNHASIKLALTDSQKGNKAIKSYQSNR